MARTIILRLGLAAIGTGVGVALIRRMARGSTSPFYDETEPPVTPRAYGRVTLAMPFHFRHSHSFGSLHLASYDAVREMLPRDDLLPVRLPGGHALVYLLASRHLDITDASDHPTSVLFPSGGELTVAAVVARGPVHPVRALAMLATGRSGGAELFALQMPVTSLQGREAGRRGWGMPKFVADFEFEDAPEVQRVRVAEADADILKLSVRPGGRPSVSTDMIGQYDVLDGRLVRTEMRSHGYVQRRLGGAQLELGSDHPVARELRRLGVRPQALMSMYAPSIRVVAGAPVDVGAARPYEGYAGMEREHGRFTVRYPGTGPIDQHAGLVAAAGPAR